MITGGIGTSWARYWPEFHLDIAAFVVVASMRGDVRGEYLNKYRSVHWSERRDFPKSALD